MKNQLRIENHIDFKNHSLNNISQDTSSSEPTDDNHVATNFYVDSLSENDRNIRSLSTLFNDQVIEFDNFMLTNLDNKKIRQKVLF